jgi:hypothetical protein
MEKLKVKKMNYNVYEIGDILEFKKNHPCGSKTWKVIKTGVTYKLECLGCKRIILIDRVDLPKRVKKKMEVKELQ